MELNLTKYSFTKKWFLKSEIKMVLLDHINVDKKYSILEVGCFEGLSACAFSDNIMDHPDSTLDCVDPFILSGTNPDITSLCITKKTKEYFLNNINKSKNSKKICFHNTTSNEFFKTNNKMFNLIYLDGCHEPDFILQDMENGFNFLENGGIMWMDDYGGNTSIDKCKIHMDKFLDKHKGEYVIIHKKYQLAIKKI